MPGPDVLHPLLLLPGVGVLLATSRDRLLAVCSPLQYSSVLAGPRVAGVGLARLLKSPFLLLPSPFLAKRLPVCGSNALSRACRLHPDMMHLACANTTVSSVYGFFAVLAPTRSFGAHEETHPRGSYQPSLSRPVDNTSGDSHPAPAPLRVLLPPAENWAQRGGGLRGGRRGLLQAPLRLVRATAGVKLEPPRRSVRLPCADTSVNSWTGLLGLLCSFGLGSVGLAMSCATMLKTVLSTASKEGPLRALNPCASHVCAVAAYYSPTTGMSLAHRLGRQAPPLLHSLMAHSHLHWMNPIVVNPVVCSIETKEIRGPLCRFFSPRQL
ncbi:hypothetical protein lerEdw1_012732 [Lerista edwardsae]|nr:hypothetical protein lerEdw1_012732 [Lerista edwardsae]